MERAAGKQAEKNCTNETAYNLPYLGIHNLDFSSLETKPLPPNVPQRHREAVSVEHASSSTGMAVQTQRDTR